MRLTVADAINSRIPASLGLCLPADRTRFLQWLSEAESRLLSYGRWWGSIQEVQFCVRECLLNWPREVATIEQISVSCGGSLDLANSWYAYNRPVASAGSCSCSGLRMENLARRPCSFDVTNAPGKLLRFYPTHSSDVGKTILVQGRDSNNIWVRTQRTDPLTGVITYFEGEQVILAFPYVDTLTTWAAGSPLAIQKSPTNYRVLMYEHDILTSADRSLAIYQPSETNPSYRVSRIVGLSNTSTGCSETCGLTTIKALVKLAHIPFTSDSDWLLFENLASYKEAMLAVRDWENGDLAAGNVHFYGIAQPKQARMSNQATLRQGGAIPMLRAELRSMSGDLTEVQLHHFNADSMGQLLADYR